MEDLAIDIDEDTRRLARDSPLRSERDYRKSVSDAEKSGNPREKLKAYTLLAHLYYLTGQLAKSVQMGREALSIVKAEGLVAHEVPVLRDSAAAYVGWGEYDRAEELNEVALELALESSDLRSAQMIRNNRGVIKKYRGRYRTAKREFIEALALDPRPTALRLLTLRNLGDLCLTWREFDCAKKTYEMMLDVAEKISIPARAAQAHVKFAELFAELGANEQAIQALEKATALLTGTGGPVDLVSKLMGDLYLGMGNSVQADLYLSLAGYDSSLGRLKLLQSEPAEAHDHYLKLRRAAERASNLNALFSAHMGIARVAEIRNRYGQAFESYTAALEVCERIRARLPPGRRRNFYAARVNGFYRSAAAKGLVRVALKTKRPEASVYPSETIRARSFADNLSRRGKGDYFNVSEDVLHKESRLNERLAALKCALHAIDKESHPKRFVELEAEIREAHGRLESFIRELRRDHPEYAAVKYPEPVTLDTSRVGREEYLVILDQIEDGVAVRLAHGKKILEGYIVPWSLSEQRTSIAAFRAPFERCNLKGFDVKLARRLHEKLLSPC